MTRGRRKDDTIPNTRSLTVQRDYRARKARYISDLETRCKSTEEENLRLREELSLLRTNGSHAVQEKVLSHVLPLSTRSGTDDVI